jgi:arginine utilization protein RocB
MGTVGKLLPTVFIAGVPAHSGFPLNGLNAATVAAAIAARVEWSPDLTDDSQSQSGTPPSLLSIRDGKAGYDVTTPATAFATFNVLSYRRTQSDVLDRFDRLCMDAASDYLDQLDQRRGSRHSDHTANKIPLYRYEALMGSLDAEVVLKLDAVSRSIAGGDLSLPEQCRVVTEEAWRLSRLPGPAIITGFGSIPYLATNLSNGPIAARLREIVANLAAESEARYGSVVSCTEYFAGISDMSFFGEVDASGLDIVGNSTPMWKDGVRWPKAHGLANIATINIGPWGRDYHTPLERLHTGYAFGVLPQLVADTCKTLLGSIDDP